MAKSKTVGIDIPSYANGPALLEGEALSIAMDMKDMTPVQIGYKYGLDRFYGSEGSIRSVVFKTYQKVMDNPSEYGLDMETAGKIQEAVTARSVGKAKIADVTQREKRELEKANMTELVTSARDKGLKLLHRKLDIINTHKGIKEEKLVDIAKVVGLLFDKSQVARGEATQHIAVLSRKIKDDMTPEEAMQVVLQGRENVAVQKENKYKKK